MSKHVRRPRLRRLVDNVRPLRNYVITGAVVAVVGGLVGPPAFANAATALGYHSVTNSKIAPDAVSKSKIRNESVGAGEIVEGSVTWGNLAQSTRDRITAVVAVTAQTQLIGRDDGGHNGTWAKDNMLRVLAIQRHAEVPVGNCGGSEDDHCWFYTATVSDSGTFTTLDGAKSPRAGVDINGTVSGTVTGNGVYEFYSSDATPNANLVPATEDDTDGTKNGSSVWPRLAFPDGSVHGLTEHKYAYTYTATNTCETWIDASNNNDGADASAGDITGVNACK